MPGDFVRRHAANIVDGWLCEIKDVQIRDGCNILGQNPTEQELTWCWPSCGPPAVRRRTDPSACGRHSAEDAPTNARQSTRLEASPRSGRGPAGHRLTLRRRPTHRQRQTSPRCCVRRHRSDTPVGWHRNRNRAGAKSFDGRFIPAGSAGVGRAARSTCYPPGATYPGIPAVPSRLAWEAGVALADSLLAATAMSMVVAVVGGCRCGALGDVARPATTSPASLRCWGFGRYGDDASWRRVIDLVAGRAGPPAHRRDGTDSGFSCEAFRMWYHAW